MVSSKVRDYLKGKESKVIVIDGATRACVHCIWYEQLYRKSSIGSGEWVPISSGTCLLHDCQRGALRKPCKDYEVEAETAECKRKTTLKVVNSH